MVQNQPWPTHTKNWCLWYDLQLSDSRHSKSARTTDNIVCSQNDEVMHPDLCGAPIVVHFYYVKFAAEYLL